MAGEFSSIGLLMAAVTSVSNVFKDVASKKVLDQNEVIATTFWLRIVVTTVVGIALLVRIFYFGFTSEIRDGGAIFGIEALHFSPLLTFLFYLTLDGIGVGLAAYLYQKALQVSPLSVCAPFLAFTPIFLIPTGYILLGELPPAIKLLGVCLVVVGSLVMHRQLFAIGIFEPVRAIFREKGSRYVLLVSFIFALTNPLDKILVTMSDAFTQAFAYCIALFIFFAVLTFTQKSELSTPIKTMPKWILLAGTLDALALILQLSSHNYIDVVITISVKRAGIILAVLLGWLVFRERNITDKVIAAMVMLAGVLIIYLPLSVTQSIFLTLFVLFGMVVALFLTRNQITEIEPLINSVSVE